VKIAIRVYWFLDTLVYIGMIGGCLAGLLVGWLVDWRGSAVAGCGVLLDFSGKAGDWLWNTKWFR